MILSHAQQLCIGLKATRRRGAADLSRPQTSPLLPGGSASAHRPRVVAVRAAKQVPGGGGNPFRDGASGKKKGGDAGSKGTAKKLRAKDPPKEVTISQPIQSVLLVGDCMLIWPQLSCMLHAKPVHTRMHACLGLTKLYGHAQCRRRAGLR